MVRLYAEPLVYCMGSIPDSSAVREESGTETRLSPRTTTKNS